jgi:hypothetical protein
MLGELLIALLGFSNVRACMHCQQWELAENHLLYEIHDIVIYYFFSNMSKTMEFL